MKIQVITYYKEIVAGCAWSQEDADQLIAGLLETGNLETDQFEIKEVELVDLEVWFANRILGENPRMFRMADLYSQLGFDTGTVLGEITKEAHSAENTGELKKALLNLTADCILALAITVPDAHLIDDLRKKIEQHYTGTLELIR